MGTTYSMYLFLAKAERHKNSVCSGLCCLKTTWVDARRNSGVDLIWKQVPPMVLGVRSVAGTDRPVLGMFLTKDP